MNCGIHQSMDFHPCHYVRKLFKLRNSSDKLMFYHNKSKPNIIHICFIIQKENNNILILHLQNFAWARSKGKVYFKFHKVHSQPANSASSTTKSTLLHRKECFIHSIKHSLRCNKALFVGNKAQLPMCSSAG